MQLDAGRYKASQRPLTSCERIWQRPPRFNNQLHKTHITRMYIAQNVIHGVYWITGTITRELETSLVFFCSKIKRVEKC